jgi:hypothetical protein
MSTDPRVNTKLPTDVMKQPHWHMVHCTCPSLSTTLVRKLTRLAAHACLKTGFESIERHLASPPMDDMLNFFGYCEAWASVLEIHHDSEVRLHFRPVRAVLTLRARQEVAAFPVLNTKMDFSGELAQHEVIHAFLDKFSEALRRGKEDPASFDAAVVKTAMEDIKEPLVRGCMLPPTYIC